MIFSACLAFATFAQPAEVDDQTAVQIEALNRLKGTDLESNAALKSAVLRILEKTRGTPQFVEIVRDFNLKGHADALLEYATARVREIAGTRIIGEARHKTGVLSFVLEGAHPHDAGTILDREGVAVRTGQHCAQPVMDRYGITATIRASLAIYNTREDIDALVRGLARVREVFG